MNTGEWKPFPHDSTDYGYEGDALERAWPELHRGHCEPFPDAAFVARAFARHPKLEGKLDAEKTAAALQSAWRAYHRGDFAAAVAEGTALGPIGANAANKAANIYAGNFTPAVPPVPAVRITAASRPKHALQQPLDWQRTQKLCSMGDK